MERTSPPTSNCRRVARSSANCHSSTFASLPLSQARSKISRVGASLTGMLSVEECSCEDFMMYSFVRVSAPTDGIRQTRPTRATEQRRGCENSAKSPPVPTCPAPAARGASNRTMRWAASGQHLGSVWALWADLNEDGQRLCESSDVSHKRTILF